MGTVASGTTGSKGEATDLLVVPEATGIAELEAYLLTAEPITRYRTVHGAHPSYRIQFQGGVLALGKPADEGGDGERRVHHEVAGWKVAEGLGWPDLVSTTVMREMESGVTAGAMTTFSVQVIWPSPIDNPDLSQLRDADIWRAAAFDAVTVSTDRSQNWLGVPPGPPYQLALIDHGDAFATASSSISSVFFSARQGQPLPEAILRALEQLRQCRPDEVLAGLLEPPRLEAMVKRVHHLLGAGILSLPVP